MPSDRAAAAQRDAGLRRVSRLTRWLLAGALALTAGFSTIAARSFSGSSGTNQASGTTTTTDDDSSQSGTGSDDDSSSALQSPSSSPSASGGSGMVTSGGS